MKLSRRWFLGGVTALGCGLPPEDGPASPDFPLGVAAGDPAPDGALLWTRWVGAGALRLEVWPRDGADAPRVFEVSPTDQGIVLFTVTGLPAGTWWKYVFIATKDGVETRSDEGRFRTAIAADALEPLHFGVSSCSKQTWPLTPFTRAAEELECDAFLLLGDTVYADGAETLEDYRGRWREALSRRPYRLLRGSAAQVNTWDDHEIVNDAAGEQVPPARIAAARKATFEHQPWRADAQAPERLWRSLRFGRTAEVFVLDCRSERSVARREYVSRAQLDWLKHGLATSPAAFKLVLNSVPISSYDAALFQLLAHDRWEGWPEQRTELLRFIDEQRIGGVLWLTGDFHIGVAGRVSLEGPGASQVEIAAGPAGQGPNPSPSYPGPPQFDFATAKTNIVSLQLDPVALTARVRFLDGGTKTLFEHVY